MHKMGKVISDQPAQSAQADLKRHFMQTYESTFSGVASCIMYIVCVIPVKGLLGNWVRLDYPFAVSNQSYDRLKINSHVHKSCMLPTEQLRLSIHTSRKRKIED